MKAEIAQITEGGAILGECPVWNSAEKLLYWTDVFGQRLHKYDPASQLNSTVQLDERMNSFGFREQGGLIAGCWKGFGRVDPQTGQVDRFWNLDVEQPGFFLNDGKCDRAGRYWAGTVCETYDRAGSALYKLSADGSFAKAADGALASNGIAFSEDDRHLYYADSVKGVVWIFDFDLAAGTISNRRVFVECQRPDGAAVDTLGRYWVASFGQGEILCFTPDGRLDRIVRLPVTQVSMCAFGGPNLDQLFVTTGTFRLSDGARAEQPGAGALYRIDGLGAQGLPEPFFKS